MGSSDLKDLVGITIHVDGAEFYSNDEFYVYSFSSVFSTSSFISDVLLHKFPIALFAERDMDNEVECLGSGFEQTRNPKRSMLNREP
jgi:hypothetical protein